jgi:hypothetical protein
MSDPRELDQEEFSDIASRVMDVMKDVGMTNRDVARILMTMAIHICMDAAPSFSVGVSELSKTFVYTLYPHVNTMHEEEIKALREEREDEDGAESI